MKRKPTIIVAALLIAAAFVGGRCTGQVTTQHDSIVEHPGPEVPDTEPLGRRQIRLSSAATKLAEIQTLPVERRFVATEIRMVGKVEYDETRVASISAWMPGRLDRLYVDYTGVPVQAGEHLVSIFSPDLIIAQQELIQAAHAPAVAGEQSPLVRERAEATLHAAREKLRLWGLTPQQIREIERSKSPSDRLTIYSPISGTVVHKQAVEGMYVKTGDHIYTIADLSQVWVRLDAYESDLPWLHYGQEVRFETEAYPGRPFTGRIAFIDPVLDPLTRTVKVRVSVPNPEGLLKPQLFVRAIVRASIAADGKVINPELAGKWISPMHPEIIKDKPGRCDICGQPLVSAESLGYAPADPSLTEAPLVIPATAPLITGRRALVYVSVPDQPGTYEGREIVLGPRAGDFYHVLEGLREGEQVVVHGAFKIDSEVQIQSKPSMMNPEGGGPMPGHDHGAKPAPARQQESPPAGRHEGHGT